MRVLAWIVVMASAFASIFAFVPAFQAGDCSYLTASLLSLAISSYLADL
jgi:hypothetical protein